MVQQLQNPCKDQSTSVYDVVCDNQTSKGLFKGTLVKIFCVFWPKAPALMGVRGALGVHCPEAKGPADA